MRRSQRKLAVQGPGYGPSITRA